MSEIIEITAARARQAAERIHDFIIHTPLQRSEAFSADLDASVYFKLENLQATGSFKLRGATNRLLTLLDEQRSKGCVAASSGNHGAALAYAARSRGIPCHVVMPDTAPAVKVDAVRGYGAEIHFCKGSDRDRVCAQLEREHGFVLVHPFENPFVIAGQGTAALELLDHGPGHVAAQRRLHLLTVSNESASSKRTSSAATRSPIAPSRARSVAV